MFMDILPLRHRISTTLISFVARFSEPDWDAAPPRATDTLQQEICQLEQALVEFATRPSRVVRAPKPLTEQQKIIDLAG